MVQRRFWEGAGEGAGEGAWEGWLGQGPKASLLWGKASVLWGKASVLCQRER